MDASLRQISSSGTEFDRDIISKKQQHLSSWGSVVYASWLSPNCSCLHQMQGSMPLFLSISQFQENQSWLFLFGAGTFSQFFILWLMQRITFSVLCESEGKLCPPLGQGLSGLVIWSLKAWPLGNRCPNSIVAAQVTLGTRMIHLKYSLVIL